MRTPLLAGRNFDSGDSTHTPPVAVINQTLARRFFPGVNPIGRTYRAEGEGRRLDPVVEVVGVVKDAKYESLREETLPTVFLPTAQAPVPGWSSFELRTTSRKPQPLRRFSLSSPARTGQFPSKSTCSPNRWMHR